MHRSGRPHRRLLTDDQPTELEQRTEILVPTKLDNDSHADQSINQDDTAEELGLPPSYATRFRNLHLLGQGGVGIVYSAYDSELDRTVALKALHTSPQGLAPREFAQREARAVANLHHPNIVTLYDWVAAKEQAWLILEYVPGATLAEWVRKHGPFEPNKALDICIQVCQALQYAHDRGVWHLDIKPGNVLLADATVKITDFGIALHPQPGQTNPGWGTPGFAPPEQLAGNPVAQSDVYAVAALLWWLMTGTAPDKSLVQRRKYWLLIPSSLRPVLTTALSPRPEVRPATPQALAHALQRSAQGEPNKQVAADRTWNAVLAGIWAGGVSAIVGGSSPLAITSAGKAVWMGVALATLSAIRPASAMLLALLALAVAFIRHAPTIGLMLVVAWPVLAVLVKARPRELALVFIGPFLYAAGLSGLVPVLAGVLLSAAPAAWVAAATTSTTMGVLAVSGLPLVQSYLQAADANVGMPTFFRQALAIVLQVSPRDIIFVLTPTLWRSATSATTLWLALGSAVVAVGVSWGRERFSFPQVGGLLALLIFLNQGLHIVLGGSFSGLHLLINFVSAWLAVEAAPGRVEGNLATIAVWLAHKFPGKSSV